jgi:gliding motility-associated protein GldM
MAGGKETPRQKMIGMMYLVLTALLALNVSKEIIQAFVTLNDKLEDSRTLVEGNAGGAYQGFTEKKLALQATGGDLEPVKFWESKANKAQKESAKMIGHILGDANAMIKIAEKVDWFEEKDADGNITKLKPLNDIQRMDDYDTPTLYFLGKGADAKNFSKDAAGVKLIDAIHKYRNTISEEMGNYELNGKKYTFKAPDKTDGLKDAFKTANPDDTSRIAQVYRLLTQPETSKTKYGGKVEERPYIGVLFYHAPVVATAAILTSMTVDIRSAETQVAEYFLSKVDAPSFNFNKIEPMAFARTAYLNAGDTMSLTVQIAARDTTEEIKVRYNGSEYQGAIPIKAGNPGPVVMKGEIAVKERGQEVWKPWSFNYTVGKPSGAISLPEMNVLYRSYPNIVVGAASGFPDYKLVGTSNVSLSRSGAQYIATPGQGATAIISLQGVSPDGKSANLGSFDFRVRPLPPAQIYFGAATNGGRGNKNERNLAARYDNSVTLDVKFSVLSWELEFKGRTAQGLGSVIGGQGAALLQQAKPGDNVTILVKYKGPDGVLKPGAVSVKL